MATAALHFPLRIRGSDCQRGQVPDAHRPQIRARHRGSRCFDSLILRLQGARSLEGRRWSGWIRRRWRGFGVRGNVVASGRATITDSRPGSILAFLCNIWGVIIYCYRCAASRCLDHSHRSSYNVSKRSTYTLRPSDMFPVNDPTHLSRAFQRLNPSSQARPIYRLSLLSRMKNAAIIAPLTIHRFITKLALVAFP